MGTDAKYHLDKHGHFVIENYNQARPFSNFFPGVAGIYGIPMWVFYVNRGQCISSFGIESKDKAILEFQPANKAYRLTSIQGFRTFLKVTSNKKTVYWEPFQENLPGTIFKKNQRMKISSHDLILEEINFDLGLKISVRYFTLPEEPFAALVRDLKIENLRKKSCTIEMADGLPAISPYGLTDWIAKHMSRTVEAWVKVRNLKEKAPYFQLNVEVHDKPEVKHIKEGNFYFSLAKEGPASHLLDPIVESAVIFGSSTDFTAPTNFLRPNFRYPVCQQTSNRTPCAMSYARILLKPVAVFKAASFCGYAHSENQLKDMTALAIKDGYLEEKAKRNEEIIAEIKNYALTKTSSDAFNHYASCTFLDNILRGGLPTTLKTAEGETVFNVFSRKHGDLERDYNQFVLAPTYYSQGNGSYRDVNQNRRHDVWFNPAVKDSHIIHFMNLVQADGYNPLTIKGTSFTVDQHDVVKQILDEKVKGSDKDLLKKYLKHAFLPGDLLKFIANHDLVLKSSPDDFLNQILSACHKQEPADHGEGFWTDHWTYNLDLIESYLSVYPEQLKNLLLDKKVFSFYLNNHYVLPRDQRYILTAKGVRQYHSVFDDSKEIKADEKGRKLKVKNGEGSVYLTHLTEKLLCLIANKAASFDPSGIGIEMEADKPNWYDALNGLPGLLGSSVAETFELKRMSSFLLTSLKQVSLKDGFKISIFSELATLISGLSNLLALENNPQSYWTKSNDVKEHYRQRVRHGIDGVEFSLSFNEIEKFLKSVIVKTDKAIKSAKDKNDCLATYFYHDVTKFERLDKDSHDPKHHVRPLEFRRQSLPLFLEGYVHALRVEENREAALNLYRQVRASDLFDKKLMMYKVNTDLSGQSEEIGRTRIFPPGWLENGSIWLHMEYKFMLELLRRELYDEFYDNFKSVLVPFLNPQMYGRSILENSSFIVSSAHEDESLHGQGFVARLSGSTAEFLHIWLLMNLGPKPFQLNAKGELSLTLSPALPGWLFTKRPSVITHRDKLGHQRKIEIPKDSYAFYFLGGTLVVYNNPKRKNTFGDGKANVKKIELSSEGKKTVINAHIISSEYAHKIRNQEVDQIDVFLQ